MSFAAETKKELTQIEESAANTRSELQAILALGASLVISDNLVQMVVETENVATARRIYVSLKSQFDVRPEVIVRKKMRLKKNNIYGVYMSGSRVAEVLRELGYQADIADGSLMPEWMMPEGDGQQRAFLRGAFLAGGSVNAPGSPSYHMEVYTTSQVLAKQILDYMNEYELHARMTSRKRGFIVYLKEGEKIVDFLNLIGAVGALLKFEDTRILKGMRNQVNRLVNCETANLNKTISAAVRQVETIQYIEHRIGLEQLPEHLREVALVRIRYPESTLQELSKHLGNHVSKSGLNHRFKRLEQLADRLRGNTSS